MNKAFLNYPEWQATADTLHMLLQIIGKIKLERNDKRPEWAHVRQYLTLNGLTTGIIPGNLSPFEISVDFRRHYIMLCNAEGRSIRLPLRDGISIAGYYEQIHEALKYIGSPTTINVRAQEFYDPIDFDQDEKHHSYDAAAVTLFLDNLLFAYHVLNKFISPFRGKADFPAYYFGTMDLSCVVYSGEASPFQSKGSISYPAFDERNCEFGFWPGDPKALEPSFYVMPYPFISSIKEFGNMLRPDKAVFKPEKKEFFLTLKDALSYDNPDEKIIDFFSSSLAIVQQLKKWENWEWITHPLNYK